MSDPFTLCVLLWPRPGRDAELHAYEDEVLALLADHGAGVRARLRCVDDGTDAPAEVHLLDFPSQGALDAYLTDDRRVALATRRDAAIARTEQYRLQHPDAS